MADAQKFVGAYAKVNRTRELIEELDRAIKAFAATYPIKFEVTTRAAGVIGIGMNVTFIGVPERIATILGDAVHNLRSALDHAAGTLVHAAGGNAKGVYFPFCDVPAELPQMIKAKKFHRAGPWAVSFLESLQPYRGGNTALRALHDLDVQDKHHSLVPSGACFASPVIRLWDDDGTFNPTVMGDPHAASAFTLVFANGIPFAGKQLIPTLHDLVQMTECVIVSFERLSERSGFPGP